MNDMHVDLMERYAKVRKRLLLLDYDGTLIDLKQTPQEASPTPALLDFLRAFTGDVKNKVVIISGRDHITLDKWLGQLPLAFAAEHGLLYKEPGQDWRPAIAIDTSWKSAVRVVMEQYVAKVRDTFIEEKTNALVWHFRTATNPGAAERAAAVLAADMRQHVRGLSLRLIEGNKNVEIQPAGVDKGMAATHWLEREKWDFVLAAGDDTTDEDLFATLPEHAFTIKVGPGPSQAKIRVATPADLRSLLLP